MAVFVLDKRQRPLMPCSEKRARLLLARGRAVVVRMYPFTIRLRDRVVANSGLQPARVKFDPGSKTTGIAVVRELGTSQHVLVLLELRHRGQAIRDVLAQRRALRHARRTRKTRYRAPRVNNRRRREGWLPPSLQHRVDTTLSRLRLLYRLTPVTAISTELVRFDMQKLDTPDISGVEYQQGELASYEVREYLLEKWGRQCAYCGNDKIPLEVEHIQPRSRGGSNRVSNLTVACRMCNEAKGNRDVREFLAYQPEVLQRIQAQAKAPLTDAAAINTTRWVLFNALKATGLAVEVGRGGRTKWHRSRLGIPKTHALDAACVGDVDTVTSWHRPTLVMKATGRGAYQRTRLTAHGFPRGYVTRQKRHFGFQTGDLVRAIVPSGKKQGIHVGRVAVRATGSFDIQAPTGVVQGISHRYCRRLQRGDGYGYFQQPKALAADVAHAFLSRLKSEVSSARIL